MRPLVIAIHGILTGQTSPNWTDQLDAWLFARDQNLKVIKKEYSAGPWPRWNCLVRDPRLAEGLAAEVALFAPASASADPPRSCSAPPIWIVAHSNGAVIAMLTARKLVARGYCLAGLILIGAACRAELRSNGVLAWLRSGQLGLAIAFCCAEDAVLGGSRPGPGLRNLRGLRGWFWRALIWPYGTLGCTGWRLDGQSAGTQLRFNQGVLFGGDLSSCAAITIWFEGGHSAYFNAANQVATFELIYQLIGSRQRAMPQCTDAA